MTTLIQTLNPTLTKEQLEEISKQWIDPITTPVPDTTYHLFQTLSRGEDTQGSYLIYLLGGYYGSIVQYPVIYWLHGGSAMRDGKMGQTIIVLPQALPVGWYVNSKDGKRPVENVVIQDLISHIDNKYRTIAGREGRGIEGMSMGGYGTLHLGFKYPTLFGVISSVAPPLLPILTDEPKERSWDTFNGDQAYYDSNAPWTLAIENANVLRKGISVRSLAGGQDSRLVKCIGSMIKLLEELDIKHDFIETKDAGHDYDVILAGVGDRAFSFWQEAFPRS